MEEEGDSEDADSNDDEKVWIERILENYDFASWINECQYRWLYVI